MSKKWTFMRASGVYIYASANADDGGNVNSEENINRITYNIINKNYVIRKDKTADPLPLYLFTNGSSISLYQGSGILDGYYIKLDSINSSNYIFQGIKITTAYIDTLQDFIDKLRNVYYQYYDRYGNKINYPKGIGPTEPIPTIHLILKLVNDISGNVRGDLLERVTYNDPQYLMNRGCAWALLTSDELAEVNYGYLDLGTIYINPDSTVNNVMIDSVDNDNGKYSYIDMDSVYTYDDDGNVITLGDYINITLESALDDLDTITFNTKVEGTEARIKTTTLSVRDDRVYVRRYTPVLTSTGNYQYDEDGNVIVEEIQDEYYNNEYSLDFVRKTTHRTSCNPNYNSTGKASVDGDTTYDESKLANTVDSRDNAKGFITIEKYNNGVNESQARTDTKDSNGYSNLISRADHLHDNRYVLNDPYSNEQTIYGTVNINSSSSSKSYGLNTGYILNSSSGTTGSNSQYILMENGEFNGKYLTTNGKEFSWNGNMTATGDITGDRVFNAVWNDYAELYKKDDINIDYPAGSVICKVKGKDTYTLSNKENKELVVGVVTNSYGHLVGGDYDKTLEENLVYYIPISLCGRVYVNVEPNVIIYEGDLLKVSNKTDGCATKIDNVNIDYGTIIGKALESSDGDKQQILIQIMLK